MPADCCKHAIAFCKGCVCDAEIENSPLCCSNLFQMNPCAASTWSANDPPCTDYDVISVTSFSREVSVGLDESEEGLTFDTLGFPGWSTSMTCPASM